MAFKSLLNNKPDILIQQFYNLMVDKGIPVEKIILFGSYVRRIPKPWSDIDIPKRNEIANGITIRTLHLLKIFRKLSYDWYICVVSKIFGKNQFDETVRLQNIASDIDPLIEPHPYHPKDLSDKWDPLAVEINKHGKVISRNKSV